MIKEILLAISKFNKSKLSFFRKRNKLIVRIDNIIDKNYNKLSSNYFKRAEKESKNLIKFKNKFKIDIKSIINKKIAGLTTKDRFNRNQSKIKRQVKKIVKKIPQNFKQSDIESAIKEIQLKLKIDRNKAKRIIVNELHRVREETKSQVAEKDKTLIPKWNTLKDSKVRDTHKMLDGKLADSEGYFYSSGARTKYPGGFGIAKEDIHCRCYLTFVKNSPTSKLPYSRSKSEGGG